eukprot:2133611-Rhodomonas_salina.3
MSHKGDLDRLFTALNTDLTHILQPFTNLNTCLFVRGSQQLLDRRCNLSCRRHTIQYTTGTAASVMAACLELEKRSLRLRIRGGRGLYDEGSTAQSKRIRDNLSTSSEFGVVRNKRVLKHSTTVPVPQSSANSRYNMREEAIVLRPSPCLPPLTSGDHGWVQERNPDPRDGMCSVSNDGPCRARTALQCHPLRASWILRQADGCGRSPVDPEPGCRW